MYRRPDHLQRVTDFMSDLNAHTEASTHPSAVSAETKHRLKSLMYGNRSTLDGPLYAWIPELVATYPSAKFILTLRSSRDEWWRSWRESVGIYFTGGLRYRVYHALVYPVGFLRKMDEMCQVLDVRQTRDWNIKAHKDWGPQVYDRHAAKVREMVPPERLLEYNVKE